MKDSEPTGIDRLKRRAAKGKLLLGMVHLRPLPGSPRNSGEKVDAILEWAKRDAEAILEAGFDGWIVENFGDTPFFKDHVPPETIAAMTRIAAALPRRTARGAVALAGVNVLRNDARAALGVAAAADLDLFRVNVHTGAMVADQGLIEGKAAETLRARTALGAHHAILADLLVKHAVPLGMGPVEPGALALDLIERGGADGIIVSGPRTGAPADLVRLRAVKAAVPRTLLLVGSGATRESIQRILETADGVIVGSSLKKGSDTAQPIDRKLAQAFVRAAR